MFGIVVIYPVRAFLVMLGITSRAWLVFFNTSITKPKKKKKKTPHAASRPLFSITQSCFYLVYLHPCRKLASYGGAWGFRSGDQASTLAGRQINPLLHTKNFLGLDERLIKYFSIFIGGVV